MIQRREGLVRLVHDVVVACQVTGGGFRYTHAVTVRAKIREHLDVGRRRWVLSPLASADVSRERGELCLVFPSFGWVHRYRTGSIEWPAIGAPSPAALERETLDVFLHRYRPSRGDTVVDVGAGVGEEVRTFSELVGEEGLVVAVEAHPRAAELLRRNVKRWRLSNVRVVEAAVAGEVGTTQISDENASIGNRLVSSAGVAVRALTFDGLLEETRISEVDFLKMNIEGAERGALAASRRLTSVLNAAISCHDFLVPHGADPEVVATQDAVKDILLKAGFDLVERPDDPRAWVSYYLYASRGSPTTRRSNAMSRT